MNNFNTAWITGTPRTGSMWTTNVIREIFKSKEFDVYPKEQLQNDTDWEQLYQTTALNDKNEKNKYVIKTHTILKPGLPNSKYITNARNPFDICASYYEFMQCDINSAINCGLSQKNILGHYESFEDGSFFVVQYERLESSPTELISNLAKFLECEISYEKAELISQKLSKQKVKWLISNTDAKLNKKISKNKEINENEIVHLSGENYRAFNLDTGFQTGHVSNRKSGQWRQSFSKDEITEIIDALDACALDLGYDSER